MLMLSHIFLFFAYLYHTSPENLTVVYMIPLLLLSSEQPCEISKTEHHTLHFDTFKILLRGITLYQFAQVNKKNCRFKNNSEGAKFSPGPF